MEICDTRCSVDEYDLCGIAMNDVPAEAGFVVYAQYHNICGLDCPRGYVHGYDWPGYDWSDEGDYCIKRSPKPEPEPPSTTNGTEPICPVGSMYDSSTGYGCVKCPIEDACLSGLGCEYGYQDLGCGNCIDGWFFINDQCRKCPKLNIYLMMSLGILFTFIFGYLVYQISSGLINFAGASTISITHLQLVDIYIRLKIPIPDVFYDIVNLIGSVLSFMYFDLFFSPECSTNTTFYSKWAILISVPVGIIVLIAAAVFIHKDTRVSMINLMISAVYIHSLNQCWKRWDCVKLRTEYNRDIWILESDPGVKCFDYDNLSGGPAIIATIMLLMFSAFPYVLYYQMKNKRDDESTKKKLGFLFLKYKDEYWWWDPVVEMSKKWMVVFWSTFMPTADTQVAMEIVIVVIYWYIHAKNLPFKTDWKDNKGNLLPDKMQHLENNLQNWMYCAELMILVGMMLFFRDGEATDARDAGTVILFIVYFGAIMLIGVNIACVWLRQRERDERSSRYRTVVVEATVAEMVETVEQDKAFGTDDCNDLPKKCGFL